MKTLAFVVGLCIAAVGVAGVLAPYGLKWIAQHFVNSDAFYVIAMVRVALGLLLVSVARKTRVPGAMRVLGYILVIAGIGTALMAMLGMPLARAIINWWLQQGSVLTQVTGVVVLAIGALVAYACAPAKRTAQLALERTRRE
ncbi:MAG: hypothetical protein WA825_17635 [Steroidobacteraceae bacterium]